MNHNLIKLAFQVTEFPSQEQAKYPAAYLEGTLKISINGVIYFNQPGILLIELAICIAKWLKITKRGARFDLIYTSMDNEESILQFIHKEKDLYKIKSIWQEYEVGQLFSVHELIMAFETFLNELENVLKLKTEIELVNIFREYEK